jgi:hypothetical protein
MSGLQVWDPLGGNCLCQLEDHTGPVTTVSMYGSMLLTLCAKDGEGTLAGMCMLGPAKVHSAVHVWAYIANNTNIGYFFPTDLGGHCLSLLDAGLLVYACLGLPADEELASASTPHRAQPASIFPRTAAPGSSCSASTRRMQAPKKGSQYFRMVDAPQSSARASHSMSLVVQPWGFAIGTGTGDIHVHDFTQGGRLRDVVWRRV